MSDTDRLAQFADRQKMFKTASIDYIIKYINEHKAHALRGIAIPVRFTDKELDTIVEGITGYEKRYAFRNCLLTNYPNYRNRNQKVKEPTCSIVYLDIDGVLCPYHDPNEEVTEFVTKTREALQKFNKDCFYWLKDAIWEAKLYTNIEIALCSSWRKSHEDIIILFEQWSDLFNMRVKNKFITDTVTQSNYHNHSSAIFKTRENNHLFDDEIKRNGTHFADRGIEVQDHFEVVSRWKKYDNYFIIDDEASGYYDFQKPRLVSPNGYKGFTKEDRDAFIEKVKSTITVSVEKE